MAIQSIRRAIHIMGLFSYERSRLGISEISREMNLPKGTVQGLVQTLAKEGFLKQDPETRKYELGFMIYELGILMAANLEINKKSSGPAHELAKRCKYMARVAIIDGDSALITLDAYPRTQPFLFRQFGLRCPLYCTALGKALLAFMLQPELESYIDRSELLPFSATTITHKDQLLKELDETRERGYSINREEHLLGRAAVGAPIFGRGGKLEASICMVGPPSAILGKGTERLGNEVMGTASQISRYMGYFPEAPSVGRVGKNLRMR
ncbi:MAG: IclR family transcriptional regulator [Pseudomonadota bacterium]